MNKIKKYNGIDLYQALVTSEDEGITTISLVDYPAVESNFVCFKDEKKLVRFAVESEEKHNITGVVMLADVPIYRRTGDYEYYIVYSKETIEKMANKLLADGFQNAVSLQHNGTLISGVTMQEIYIKDETKGINPNFVDSVPDGSLMATFHIEDEDLWDQIKNGDDLNGFSLEGFFDVVPVKEKLSKNKKIEDTSIMKKLKQITKFVNSLMQFGSIETDKATLYWEGDGELETGTEVFIENEEGLKEAAGDGEYEYDGKIITIADGKVESIKDKEEDTEDSIEEEIAESAEFSKFKAIKAAFEESYEEKERQIIDAINAKGYEAYLIEAGDDFAVADVWDEEEGTYKYFRFPISWTEDGAVEVGEPEEVKSAFVPVDTDVEKIAEEEEKKEEEFEEDVPAEEIADDAAEIVENDYEDRIKALEDAIKALEDRIAELEDAPASDSVEEEFNVNYGPKSTGNRKLDKTVKLFSALRK